MATHLAYGASALPQNAVQGAHVHVGLGQQALELGVLAFEFTQPLVVRNIHAPDLGLPLVESGVAEAAFAAEFLDWHAGFGLFDEPDDLFFGESALPHSRHFLG